MDWDYIKELKKIPRKSTHYVRLGNVRFDSIEKAMKEWCAESLSGEYWNIGSNVWWFKKEEDAMLFVLAWKNESTR